MVRVVVLGLVVAEIGLFVQVMPEKCFAVDTGSTLCIGTVRCLALNVICEFTHLLELLIMDILTALSIAQINMVSFGKGIAHFIVT